MSVSTIGSQSALAIQQLVSMRAQFDDLQRQLSTGQKSATYAGLGLDRGVTVSLNAQLAAIGSYDDTISNVTTRISLMNTALGQMSDLSGTLKSAMTQANTAGSSSGAVKVPVRTAVIASRSSETMNGVRATWASGSALNSAISRARMASRPVWVVMPSR